MKEKSVEDEDLEKLPWDHPGFIIVRGRYYLAHGILSLEPGFLLQHGGDVVACIWRFDTEEDIWRLQIRVRRYSGPNSDPFEGGDKKDWFAATVKGSAEAAFSELEKDVLTLGQTFAKLHDTPLGKINWVQVKGDIEKFTESIRTDKRPWMHAKEEKI